MSQIELVLVTRSFDVEGVEGGAEHRWLQGVDAYDRNNPIHTGRQMFSCRPRRKAPEFRELEPREMVHYRDRLREARYAALADAEGFGEICFAIEALGLRVRGELATLDLYRERIEDQAKKSPLLAELPADFPTLFKPFKALFKTVQTARNDAMHIGAYARHATEAAIELCIGLEEALMADAKRTVGNLMVKSPMTVEPWQPVAHARQLMLMHSFSFLPVRLGENWFLVSELGLAKYLNVKSEIKKIRLGQSIETASKDGLRLNSLARDDLLETHMTIDAVLEKSASQSGPMLWLVREPNQPDRLAGVLSPFELM